MSVFTDQGSKEVTDGDVSQRCGYLYQLVMDTELDEGRDQHDDNMHDGCKLAADVFAKIDPEDYGPMLLAALMVAAPEIVNDCLEIEDGDDI